MYNVPDECQDQECEEELQDTIRKVTASLRASSPEALGGRD